VGGVEAQLQSFLTSALDGRSDSLTGRNRPGEGPPVATVGPQPVWKLQRGDKSPPPQETEARFLRRPVGNLVTILTELPRLPKSVVNDPKPTY
jgi:hypothetical protein